MTSLPSSPVKASMPRIRRRLALGVLTVALYGVAPGGVSPALAETADNAPSAAGSAPEARAGDELPSNGQLSHFSIDDADPSAAVPDVKAQMKDPIQFGYLLMDLADRADGAYEQKDFARAARYYKAIVKAAPQRSVGYTKLCLSYTGMNDLVSAREACHEGLFHEGVFPIDFVRYLHLLLDTKKQFGTDDLQQADDVFAHLKQEKVDEQEVHQLECDVALRVSDVRRMEECTKALAAGWPDDPKTITYQWSLAVYKKDFAAAEKFVQRAKASAMAPQGIQKMEAATRTAQHKTRSKHVLAGAGALALFLIGAMGLRVLRQTGTRPA